MTLTRREISRWAPSDVLEAGSRLVSSGGVLGLQTKGNILAGSVRQGSSRLVVRLVLGGERPQTHCVCAEAQGGRICRHAVAVALRYAATCGAKEDTPETMTFAAERAPTREDILRWCGPTVFARAEALYRDGAVSHVAFRYPDGEGDVWSNGTFLHVGFHMLPGGLVEGNCPCYTSRSQGLLCEHTMAVAYAVMRQYASEEQRARFEAVRRHAARMAAAADTMIRRAPEGTPAILRIFIPARGAEQFAQGRVTVAIRVYVGSKGYRPEDLPKAAYRFSEADENLLGILEDIAEGAFPGQMTLRPEDFLSVLRCAEFSWVGDAGTRHRLRVAGEPLATPLVLRPDPSQDCLRLSLRLPKTGAACVYGRVGWWLDGLVARPLAHVLPEPFRSLYRQSEAVPRSRIFEFFETEWPMLRALLPVAEGEDITPDLFTAVPGQPRFRLTLGGTPVFLTAWLEVRYGAETDAVCGHRRIAVPDPDDFYRCYVRNPDAEKTALGLVQAMGFMGEDGASLMPLSGHTEVLNVLGRYVPEVRRNGWRVSVTGAVGDFCDRTETVVPVVTVTDGDGAFEVTTDYVSPEGKRIVSREEIELAVSRNQAFVEAGDRVVLVDIGAIRGLREACDSCRARNGSKPGSVRIEAVHAPFIQAALEAMEGIDFEAAPDWRARASKQNRLERPESVPLGALEKTLRPYQKEGVYWLRFLEESGFCGILADEMGLGKTLQTITWLQLPRVREKAAGLPALVVCPTSLVENWNREAASFAPWLKRLVVSGPNRDALFAQVPQADLVITSYALIRRDIGFYSRCRFSVVVLDEAQAIKNQKTQNAQAVKQLSADTRLVLSGTPIENGVSDLWSIMDFLMPRYLGPYENFRVEYEDRIALGGADAEAAQRRLRTKLHPFLLRRVKKDVAKDLPDKIRSVTYCALTSEQRQVYDRLRTQMLEKMRGLVREKGFDKSRMEVLALLMRLRQVCCDLRLLKEGAPKPWSAPSAKLDALTELLAEARAGGHRMLVFSQFTSMLKLIAERLEAEGLEYCYLDGSTKDRLGECARFNQSDIPVFLISLKAGGTGLNLTGADMVVHFDPWWNPAAEDQATDRAHRIGQRKTVQAIKLIAENTVEEKVLEMQRKKQALIEATVNASDASIARTLTWSEIESLLA